MSRKAEKIIVQVKFGNLEETFEGSSEEVWLSLNRFFSQLLPSFEIAKKLVLNVDLQRLVEDCVGLIAFSKEGANLLVSKDKLTDNETLLLWLLAYYLEFQLGFVKEDCVSKEELQNKLGKNAKITSTRLSELVKGNMIARVSEDKYKITTFGIVHMQKEIIPKIRAKMG